MARFEYELRTAHADRAVARDSLRAGAASGRHRARSNAAESEAPTSLDRAPRAATRWSRAPANASTNGSGDRPPICACWYQPRRHGDVSRMRACRGSARRSVGTASSPRCRRSGSTRASRAACSSTWRPRRPTDVDAAAGRRTGKDPARDPQQRDGAPRRGAVRPLLRQRGRDAAVRHPGRRLLRSDRRSRRSSQPTVAACRARARVDRRVRRSRRRRLCRIRAPTRRPGSSSRDGRTRRIRCFMPTARSPSRRSRSARCRPTSTTRGVRAAAHGRRARRVPRAPTALRDERRAAARARSRNSFWCEDLSEPTRWRSTDTRRPCAVRSSNAGHCLFGGIASPERARRVAEQLVGPDMFSGWGIRTLASTESRYNPMSYHNGSVWPHDNGHDRGRASRDMGSTI